MEGLAMNVARDLGVEARRDLRTQQLSAFKAIYARWLAARAAIEVEIDDDEIWSALNKQLCAVERELLLTPAPDEWCFWRKFDVLELCVNAVDRDGVTNPDGAILALAAIKLDLSKLFSRVD
jgi:hypothetical protein